MAEIPGTISPEPSDPKKIAGQAEKLAAAKQKLAAALQSTSDPVDDQTRRPPERYANLPPDQSGFLPGWDPTACEKLIDASGATSVKILHRAGLTSPSGRTFAFHETVPICAHLDEATARLWVKNNDAAFLPRVTIMFYVWGSLAVGGTVHKNVYRMAFVLPVDEAARFVLGPTAYQRLRRVLIDAPDWTLTRESSAFVLCNGVFAGALAGVSCPAPRDSGLVRFAWRSGGRSYLPEHEAVGLQINRRGSIMDRHYLSPHAERVLRKGLGELPSGPVIKIDLTQQGHYASIIT